MKISDLMRALKNIKAEHGDLEICRKTGGALIKMKPCKINMEVISDVEIQTKYQGVSSSKKISVDEVGACVSASVADDIKDISEFRQK